MSERLRSRRLTSDFRTWIVAFSLLAYGNLVLAPTAKAEEPDNASFSSRCPVLLTRADMFAAKCKAEARSLTRYWHTSPFGPGTPETYQAYFDTSAESHFGLGCTLDSAGDIAKLGVYYTAAPTNFTQANSLKILSIETEGDVLLGTKEEKIKLVLVRDFVTARTHPLGHFDYRIKNCEPAYGEDGRIQYVQGSFTAELEIKNGVTLVTANALGTWCENQGVYLRMLKREEYSYPISATLACQEFIMNDGSILAALPAYKRDCKAGGHRYGLVGEACSIEGKYAP